MKQEEDPEVADLQAALQMLLDRGDLLRDDEGARRELSAELQRERAGRTYDGISFELVCIFQGQSSLEPSGNVDKPTANAINAFSKERGCRNSPAKRGLLW